MKNENITPRAILAEELAGSTKAQWEKIINDWLADSFKPCLEKLNFKQDCIDCGDIYFNTRLHIDSEGKLTTYEIISQEVDCRNKTGEDIGKLISCTMSKLNDVTFPAELRNMILEAKLGRLTRC